MATPPEPLRIRMHCWDCNASFWWDVSTRWPVDDDNDPRCPTCFSQNVDPYAVAHGKPE